MSFVAYKDIPDIAINEKDYLKTGIYEFDKKCLGFGKGQLIIITGTRGGGKTSLLGQIKLNFVDNGYRGLEYNLEMVNKRAKQWVVLQACGKDNLKSRQTSSGKTLYEPKSGFIAERVCEWLGEKLPETLPAGYGDHQPIKWHQQCVADQIIEFPSDAGGNVDSNKNKIIEKQG